jgi:hypothetical protein
MVHVQSIFTMEPLVVYLLFHVPIGLITMELKIIHSIVCLKTTRKNNFFFWLGWTSEISTKTIIAYSSISTFQVRLPAGDNQTSLLYLIISIRDQLDGITEYNLSSVIVRLDLQELNNFINDIEHLSNTNSIVQLLASENQNIVGQIITSFSQQLNQMNNQNINQAVSSKFRYFDN